jgi:hypothetical protein
MSGFVDHRTDGTAVTLDNAKIPGTDRMRRTIKGWQLLVEWRDGTSDWLPLADLKESYPIQVAEYAVNNKIASQPAFCMVGPTCIEETGPYHQESAEAILEEDTQVWY